MEKLKSGANKLGIELTARQLEQFSIYYQELIAWNERMNLTAITDYSDVQVKHFLDSLTVTLALEQPLNTRDFRVIDVGTGAGMPGLPLKIVYPNINLTLLEATTKKTTFLQHIIDKLELSNVEVIAGRAEDLARYSEYREKFDIVTARAVAALPTLVELALPFCIVGGRFIAMKKHDIDAEIRQAGRAISILGGNLRQSTKIDLEELSDNGRQLIIVDKVKATPPRYPRPSGMPSLKPLV